MENRFDDTTATWLAMLRDLLKVPPDVSPSSAGAEWRGRSSHEIIAHRTTIDMTTPVVRSPARKLFRKFLAAEAAWILDGDSRVTTILPFNKRIGGFSDDGVRFFGAYGPRFIDQLSFVVDRIAADRATRQAVIAMWRPLPPSSKDIPCTLSLQFLVRNGNLQTVATMRSSDAWSGWVYDVFNFSMMSALVALELRAYRDIYVGLGGLRFVAGSQHLYKLDAPEAEKCVEEGGRLLDYAPIDLTEFDAPGELAAHLWCLARGVPTPKRWLKEVFAP